MISFTLRNTIKTTKLFKKIVATSSTMPVLTMVRFENRKGKLKIIGTDLKTTIVYTQKIAIKEDFSFLLKFSDFKLLPDEVIVSVDEETVSFNWKERDMDFNINLEKIDDSNFPITKTDKSEHKYTHLSPITKEHIYNASFMASKSNFKGIFNRVLIDDEIVATDSKKIYYVDSKMKLEKRLLVSQYVARMIKSFDAVWTAKGKHYAYLSTKNYSLTFMCGTDEDKFVDIHKVVDFPKKEKSQTLKIDNKLIEAISNYLKWGSRYDTATTVISCNQNKVTVRNKNCDYLAPISITYEKSDPAEDFLFAANGKSFLQSLKKIKAHKVINIGKSRALIFGENKQRIYFMGLKGDIK